MGNERSGLIYGKTLLLSLQDSLVALLLVVMGRWWQDKAWLALLSSAGVREKVSLKFNCAGAL